MKHKIITCFPLMIVLIFLLFACGSSASEKNRVVNEFKSFLEKEIVEIDVVCLNLRNKDSNYKIKISSQSEIKKLLDASGEILKEKDFEGRYEQDYLIQLFSENGERYSFTFHKSYSDLGYEKCKNAIAKNTISNLGRAGNCGQLSMLENSKITENEFSFNTMPRTVISFQNIALIDTLERLADNIQFKKNNKEKFLFEYEKK